MNSLALIESLSNAYGACGFEDEVVEIAEQYAHSDEVSFIIQAIKPNGTLLFLPLGGWSAYTVPAHKVKVQTCDGRWVSGIVASTPVHFLTTAQQNTCPTFSDMVIDIGVPVRYIHSHHGFACMADYKNSVKLAVEIIKRLDNQSVYRHHMFRRCE